MCIIKIIGNYFTMKREENGVLVISFIIERNNKRSIVEASGGCSSDARLCCSCGSEVWITEGKGEHYAPTSRRSSSSAYENSLQTSCTDRRIQRNQFKSSPGFSPKTKPTLLQYGINRVSVVTSLAKRRASLLKHFSFCIIYLLYMIDDATGAGICCNIQRPQGGGKTHDKEGKTTYFDTFHIFFCNQVIKQS